MGNGIRLEMGLKQLTINEEKLKSLYHITHKINSREIKDLNVKNKTLTF